MFGVFGTISGLDRDRKCQSLGFCSGEYVVVLMIINHDPRKNKNKNKNKTEKKRKY